MKKQVAILLCLLAISLSGCFEEQSSSVWIYGDDDSLGVRVGTEVVENVEVGVSSVWWEDRGDSQLYGAYALYHIPGETISTYVGAQTPLNNTYYDHIAPVAGVRYGNLFAEYQYKNWRSKESQEDDKIVVGLRFPF